MSVWRRINPSGVLVIVGFAVAWQLTVSLLAPGQSTVAGPIDVVAALGDDRVVHDLLVATAHTSLAALLGWTLALVFGVGVGAWIGYSKAAWIASASSIDVLRALPPVALIAPLVLIFGFSISMEVAVIFYGCLWPILVNTALGVRQVPRQTHEVCATLRLKRAHTLFRVTLPWAAPVILVGARLALSLAVILAVVSEMVGNPEGLGYQIVFSQQALKPGALYLYIVVAGLLALALNALLVALAGRLRPIRRRTA
ncbi:ABC transporter permease [Leucobacter triazinivorans]|uniref:ABC transporter permease n=1 Tax=Leucobacter triazinivorans TaxID=1784719 RepID=UPI0013EE75D1|nr:ABC transporter permease subunit [Leucobacter triazinivorans]